MGVRRHEKRRAGGWKDGGATAACGGDAGFEAAHAPEHGRGVHQLAAVVVQGLELLDRLVHGPLEVVEVVDPVLGPAEHALDAPRRAPEPEVQALDAAARGHDHDRVVQPRAAGRRLGAPPDRCPTYAMRRRRSARRARRGVPAA